MNYQDHTTNTTRQLINMIQTGSHGQWSMPWHTHNISDLLNARNATTNTHYNGANVLTLALQALELGYPTGEWATYKQWANHDAQVRKGERSSHIIKWITRKTTNEPNNSNDDTEAPGQLLPRVYAVFNAHQVDGHDTQPAPTPTTPADQWFTNIGANITYGSDRAYYNPATDRIHIPAANQFTNTEAFHATNLHEHIHWTGHNTRLNRLDTTKPTDSPEYAAEELIAELGSAIGCARLGISPTPRPDHAAYLAHWLKALNADPKQLFRSAAAAQQALNHLEQLANPTTKQAAA